MRGYALTGRDAFLDPYRNGRRAETSAIASLRSLAPGDDTRGLLARHRARARAGAAWRHDYASRRSAGARVRPPAAAAADERGKARFDEVRAAVRTLQQDLSAARDDARSRLRSRGPLNVTLASSPCSPCSRRRRARAHRAAAGRSRPLPASAPRRAASPAATSRTPSRARAAGHRRPRQRRRGDAPADRRASSRRVREANARLDRQALELQRSNAELEQFAYVASHDLQEPLRKVASFTQLLAAPLRGPARRARRPVHRVRGRRRRADAALINDLLTFSRVGRLGRGTSSWTPRELVEAAREPRRRHRGDRRRVDVGELPAVRGESGLLTAVFQNLIGNALKFRGHDTPRVLIQAVREDDVLALHGRRQRDRHRARVRRPHLRHLPAAAHARRPTRAPASASRSAARSSSTTAAGSGWTPTAPAGTTFHFTLPVRRGIADDTDEPEAHPRPARRRRPRRRADDQGGVRGEQGPQRAAVVSDGVEALRFLRREGEFADAPRPDLILLDLNLPRKDGREVLAEVKADETCADPGGRADDVGGRGGHPAQLRAARQRLRDQAGGLRPLHRRGAPDRRVLREVVKLPSHE